MKKRYRIIFSHCYAFYYDMRTMSESEFGNALWSYRYDFKYAI